MNEQASTIKVDVILKTSSSLIDIVRSHIEYAKSLPYDSAVFNEDTTYRLSEAWTYINTIVSLNRNYMRNTHTTYELDKYSKQLSQIKKYSLELLELGDAWNWPRWAGGFEYIDSALRTSRLMCSEPTPSEAQTLVRWLVRQAIYHDDTDESRLCGIVEILHWSDVFGKPKCEGLPEKDVPLVYWLLTRLFGSESTNMHRILHGDSWCSWKGLIANRDYPLNLNPLSDLFCITHSVLNPSYLNNEVSLPRYLNNSDDV